MAVKTEQTDMVFSALADANRRRIVELLHEGDSTLLELSDAFDISFQALSKHIAILERAQVVQKTVQGKYRPLSLNRSALRDSLQWISFYSSFWNQSFDKLDDLIKRENSK